MPIRLTILSAFKPCKPNFVGNGLHVLSKLCSKLIISEELGDLNLKENSILRSFLYDCLASLCVSHFCICHRLLPKQKSYPVTKELIFDYKI